MNIIIVGEFSAFAKHLKRGFSDLGHHVVVISNGDGWKRIKGDINDIQYSDTNLTFKGKSIPYSFVYNVIKSNILIKKGLRKAFNARPIDLIIVVNYIFLSSSWTQAGVKLGYIQKQLLSGTKLIMSVCGGDPAYRLTYPDRLKEWGYTVPVEDEDVRFSFLLKNAQSIIPTSFSYYHAIEYYSSFHRVDLNKLSKAIPLPITIKKDVVIHSCVGRKIVIFHGIIRPRMKGTYFIQPAMKRIQLDFPDRVECICKGHMAYDEYLKVFDKIDILIDQASGNGWGMNSAIGAMMGKCVLVSCGKENGENMSIPDIPFVEIKRNEDSIYETLKMLIQHPEEIDRIKMSSRSFAERYCDSRIVARQYIEAVGLN